MIAHLLSRSVRGRGGAVIASATHSIDEGAYTMKIAGITYGVARILGLALLCALLVTAAGCSRMSAKWKEEVRLSSGQLITVERTARGTKTRDIVMRATGWKPKELKIRIPQAGLDVQAPPEWRSILHPSIWTTTPPLRRGRSWPPPCGAALGITWGDQAMHTSSTSQAKENHGRACRCSRVWSGVRQIC